MWEMKRNVPRGRARPAPFSIQRSARQSNQSPVGGFASAHPWSAEQRSAEQREIIVSRVRVFLPWVLGILAAGPLAPASGQNLDAGKPASQIFAEACAGCHRSPRELKSNPGTSFLREHYTTGSEMASIMSAYLSGSGSDSRGAAQPKRPPSATPSAPAGTTTTTPTREVPAADPSRDPRRTQQTPDPKGLPASTRGRPASARAEGTAAETKPPSPPTRPVLEEFEE